MAAPIQRLPVELLCTIFKFLVTLDRRDRRDDMYSVFRLSEGPWPLTRVCRQWRETAINYASLWSKVYINSGRILDLDLSSESAKDMLRTYLERSRAWPLEVELDGPAYRLRAVLPLLLSSSPRWQTAQIYLRATHTTSEIATLFNTANFSFLDTLNIKAGFLRNVWISETFAKSFPRLRALRVSGTGGALPLAVEISSLTTLTLTCGIDVPSSSIAVNSIHTLILDVQLTGIPLTFPSVHTATFTMLDSLEGLTLPSLRDISLANLDENSVDLFTQFLARSSCNIQKFRVGWRFIDLETALAQVPTVQHLDLIQWQGQSEDDEKTRFISSLQCSLLPSLQTLSISLRNQDMVPFVFDVAQVRCRDVSSSLCVLMGLDVYHLNSLDDASESLGRIETIRAAGVEVQLHNQ